MSMNVDKGGQQQLLNLLQQNPTVHVENLDASQEEVNKEKIRSSTRDIQKGLVGRHLETSDGKGPKELSITYFAPLNQGEVEPDLEILKTLFSDGKLDKSQGMNQIALEALSFLAQSDITMEELFFFIHFIPSENEDLKNKLTKLVTALDKLMKSEDDGTLADTFLFGDKMAMPENKAADKTIKELMVSLFSNWEKQVNKAMNEEIDSQKALPEPKPFLMNIFDKGILFALLLVEISRQMRDSFNEVKQSLTLSKEAVNGAAIEGILQRGREALASGISASMGQMTMTVAGGGMQMKAGKQSGAAMKSHQTQAPRVQQDITELKGQVHSSKLTRDAPNVESKSKVLGQKEAELEGFNMTKDIELKRAETVQNWGMALQSGSSGIATFVTSIGDQQQSMTEASTRQSEQVGQVLNEVYQSADESTRQQKQEQDAAFELLRSLRQADEGIYAAIRM